MAKLRCIAVLVVCNLFFVYYSLLKGAAKGREWQLLFLGGAVVQCLTEIFLFETMECLWINFFVPNLVADEVQRVHTFLVDTVNSLCVSAQQQSQDQAKGMRGARRSSKNTDIDGESRLQVLNAADYLFVSVQMAKAYPDLVESMIVQSYHSHLPGEISKKWLLGANARITRYNRSLRQISLLSSLVVALQRVGTAPFLLQRVLVRFTQPLFLTGLIILWYTAGSSPLYISLFVGVIAIGFVVVLYKYYSDVSHVQRRNRSSVGKLKIQPVAASDGEPSPRPVETTPVGNTLGVLGATEETGVFEGVGSERDREGVDGG